MPRFTQESIEMVRQRSDIIEVISGYTDLRRQGTQYTGLCPFHEERTPSFSVDPQKGLYYCFGCEAGGDVIGFVREKEGVEFPEAVERLGDRFGVEVVSERADPAAEERSRHRKRLMDALERACAYYEKHLWAMPEESVARAYLAGRGLERQVLETFRIGVASEGRDGLVRAARARGFSDRELLDAGLARSGNRLCDKFRDRIVFPIADARGRVVGFGARTLDPTQQPKYLNSSEGAVFHKGKYLYGLDVARSEISKRSEAIVVEGYTDVLALHQAGVENSVAIMGTALTGDQIAELARLTDAVFLALDADRAGQNAMLRALEAATERHMKLLVVRLPAGGDPCDLVQREGPDAFRDRLKHAVPILRFQVDMTLERADLDSASDKDRVLELLRPVFENAPPSAERTEELGRLAGRLGLPDHLLGDLYRPDRRYDPERAKTAFQAASKAEDAERTFLAMCVAIPEHGGAYLDRLTDEHLSSAALRRTRDHLLGRLDDPLSGIAGDDSELSRTVAQLTVTSGDMPCSPQALEEGWLRLEKIRLDREIAAAIVESSDTRALEQRRDSLSREIKDAVARSL